MHSKSIARTAPLLLATLCLGSARPAHAQLTQLTGPTQLRPIDSTFTYPALPSGQTSTTLPSGFTSSAGGNAATFTTDTGGSLFRFDSDGSVDFSAGTPLIETFDGFTNDGPLTLSFAHPVYEFGLSAQNFAPSTEAFSFTAYNGSTSLGTFSVSGDNDVDPGTALFLGAQAAGPSLITRVTISSTSGQPGGANDFFIGPVSAGAVPEPSSLALLGLGLAGVVAAGARRRRSAP